MADQTRQLHELARLWGIIPQYDDIFGDCVTSPPDAVFAVLRALGAPVNGWDDLEWAIRDRQEALSDRVLPPVIVVWDQDSAKVPIRRRRKSGAVPFHCTLTFDPSLPGQPMQWTCRTEETLRLPGDLPAGYHNLRIESGEEEFQALVIAAPRAVQTLPRHPEGGAAWGVFLPLYALWSGRSWGAGDYRDLSDLLEFVGRQGGQFVGLLPILPTAFRDGEVPSPYSPHSRLFWNEFHLDVDGVPEMRTCDAARALRESESFVSELADLQRTPTCEYSRIRALKHSILELLARDFFSRQTPRRHAFDDFVLKHPRLRDYAAFRAMGPVHGFNWRSWPQQAREGTLKSGDFDPETQRYHMYTQWLVHEQLSHLAGDGTGLYLDLPLGVSPDGYDVWRERDSFVEGISVGAPPDNFFLGGQNWGFPPLHPERVSEHGHHHWIAVLRHHLRHARMLRIDHVMGLHRLFWIPKGMSATEGVYVRQPQEELYAILCLESRRHRTVIVGEDLGTVPDSVREAMAQHRLHRMYVAQFDVRPDPDSAIGEPVADSIASLNTHDTPTFAGFCDGRDIDDRVDLELLDPAEAPGVRAHRASQVAALGEFLARRGVLTRPDDRAALVRALLSHMVESDAAAVLVNLEDLWLEPVSHNVPGTVHQRPNWRRKSRFSLEDIAALPEWRHLLKRFHTGRKAD